MVLLIIITLFVIVATSVFLTLKYNNGYWARRGIFTYRPKTKGENILLETYKTVKEKGLRFGAFVKYYRPSLVLVDLEDIKAILIKDADHFLNRGMFSNPKVDPTSASLPRLENEEWKSLRSILSTVFSSGKLKMIFPDLAAHSKILQEVLAVHAEKNETFEAKDIAKRFGMDAMGSCTFGFEINTLKGNNQDFQDLVKNLMRVDWKRIVENVVNRDVLKFLRIRMSDPKIYEYVEKLINDTIDYREKNKVIRNDIFQYVQHITNKELDDCEIVKNRKLSRIQMILTLQTFFVGGFETSSTVTSFAMLELAMNQDIQEKLRKNIRECLSSHGELTYEALMEMEYLDWVINESLRKYPPSQTVSRACNKAYKIPNSDIVIHPGAFVSIPVAGIHKDPSYYPNPEKFDPERFSPENKAKRHPLTFIPFGDGPRNCIGSRLGLIMAKIAVAAAISKFKITLNDRTVNPIRFKKRTLFLEVDGGVWLDCSRAD